NAELVGEALEERQPHHRFAQGAVQIDERLAITAVHDHGRLAGDVDGFGLPAGFREQDAGAVLQLLEEFQHSWESPSSFSSVRSEAPGNWRFTANAKRRPGQRTFGNTSRASNSMLLRARS